MLLHDSLGTAFHTHGYCIDRLSVKKIMRIFADSKIDFPSLSNIEFVTVVTKQGSNFIIVSIHPLIFITHYWLKV
jgi:ABC-type uncharacterized transport system permease subunit